MIVSPIQIDSNPRLETLVIDAEILTDLGEKYELLYLMQVKQIKLLNFEICNTLL